MAESPKEKGLIWVGTDDGLVHVTRDAGKTWTDVTEHLPGLPEWATIKMIEPSPFDAAAAYVVVDAHLLDDMHPYLYRTSDLGKTLDAPLDGRCPRTSRSTSSGKTRRRKGMLYAGTERGVVFSADDGKTWQTLQLNLPTVPVHDLVVKNDDLVVATHGRSLWIFDDLTPIRIFGPAIAAKPVNLLPPSPATRWRHHGTVGAPWPRRQPPAGAVLHLWLKDKPKARPKLEILDADGKLVRSLGKPTEPEPTAVEKEGAAGKEPAGEEQEAKEKEEEEEEDGPPGRPQEAEAAREAGPPPRRLGPGTRPGQADQGSEDRLRQPRDRPPGPARQIHGEADGGRPVRDRAVGDPARPARQGSCRRAAGTGPPGPRRPR